MTLTPTITARRRLALASRIDDMFIEAGGGLGASIAAATRGGSSGGAGDLMPPGVSVGGGMAVGSTAQVLLAAGATTHAQRLSLFHTLMDGCRRAVDMAGDDPKVRGDVDIGMTQKCGERVD